MTKSRFFEKKYENIWSYQKIVVPLHPLSSNGGIAQLVRAHDS